MDKHLNLEKSTFRIHRTFWIVHISNSKLILIPKYETDYFDVFANFRFYRHPIHLKVNLINVGFMEGFITSHHTKGNPGDYSINKLVLSFDEK